MQKLHSKKTVKLAFKRVVLVNMIGSMSALHLNSFSSKDEEYVMFMSGLVV